MGHIRRLFRYLSRWYLSLWFQEILPVRVSALEGAAVITSGIILVVTRGLTPCLWFGQLLKRKPFSDVGAENRELKQPERTLTLILCPFVIPSGLTAIHRWDPARLQNDTLVESYNVLAFVGNA